MTPLSTRRGIGLSLGFLMATAALITAAPAQDEAISLFAPGSARTEPPPGTGVRGIRPEAVGAVEYFTISPQASRSLRSPKPGPSQMRIELPGDKSVTCSLEGDGSALSGSVAGEDLSTCDLIVGDGKVNGAIDTDAGRFRIMPVGNGGTHAVVEVKTDAFPAEEAGPHRLESPIKPKAEDKRSLRDEPPCDVPLKAGQKPKEFGPIRVLVLYTPAAAADSNNINAEIQLMMRQLNQTLALNKNFKVTAQLAAAQEVDYKEADDMGIDLDRLSGKFPGYFDNVRPVRDRYKADFVHLIIRGSGDSCGIGWLLDPKDPGSADWGFSVSDRDCAVNNYSFIHELGHNLGLEHDRAVVDDASSEAFNYGYVAFDKGIRTVMAYNNACAAKNKNCRRLPLFSTPYIKVQGVAMGKPMDGGDGAYNAEVLCRNAGAGARFAEIRAQAQ